MSIRVRGLAAALVAVAICTTPCSAQQRAGLMGDLLRDVAEVQAKLTGLAQAIPAAKHGWRPAAGVRSVSEVFLHVAADNYLLPVAVGVQPEPATGIDPADFATLTTYERQQMPVDSLVATMNRSFAHLTKAMAGTPDARFDETVKFFGQDMSIRQVWLLTAMHLHEHLGQLIAYARANGVVPPWTRQAGG